MKAFLAAMRQANPNRKDFIQSIAYLCLGVFILLGLFALTICMVIDYRPAWMEPLAFAFLVLALLGAL